MNENDLLAESPLKRERDASIVKESAMLACAGAFSTGRARVII
jgi:hypothetical protein